MATLPQQRILVPIDFSAHSAEAVRWAALWQSTLGGTVTVQHTMQFEPPREFTVEQVDDLVRQAKRSRAQVEHDIQRFLATEVGHEVDWPIRIDDGNAVQNILTHAQQADLVIMGTHGRTGTNRWRLGSVAESVVHTQQIPTLVVRARDGQVDAPLLRRILAPTNFTATSQYGIDYAAALADAAQAELVMVNAVEQPDQQRDDQFCACIVPEVRERITVRSVVRHGNPAEEIVRLAQETAADLIVMSAEPKRFLDLHVLPPTIAQVLRYGMMPVLVLPYPQGGVR